MLGKNSDRFKLEKEMLPSWFWWRSCYIEWKIESVVFVRLEEGGLSVCCFVSVSWSVLRSLRLEISKSSSRLWTAFWKTSSFQLELLWSRSEQFPSWELLWANLFVSGVEMGAFLMKWSSSKALVLLLMEEVRRSRTITVASWAELLYSE